MFERMQRDDRYIQKCIIVSRYTENGPHSPLATINHPAASIIYSAHSFNDINCPIYKHPSIRPTTAALKERNGEKEGGGADDISSIDPSPVKKKERYRSPDEIFPMKPSPEEAIDFLAKDSKYDSCCCCG